MRKPKRARIYESRKQLIVTAAFIALPFIFLLLFSEFAHITLAKLTADINISLFRITAAYLLAAAFGWLFAISFYKGKSTMVILPIFDVLQSFPTFSILPLAVILFGPSTMLVIVFLIAEIIWPIFFSIVSSLKLIRNDWEEAVEIVGLRGFDYLKKFLWPISFPGLVTGSIIGLGDAWQALVATEIIVGVRTGVGSFFQTFSNNVNVTTFGILGFLILIFAINKVIWLPLLERSHRQMEE